MAPSLFGRLLNRKPVASMPNEFDSLYDQANSAAAAGDFARALPLYDRAIALESLRSEPYYKRGNALKNLGRLDESVASYNQAIERRPDYAYAYCNRGVVQQALGLATEALSSYDKALALDPTDAMAHYNCALLMQDGLRWDEALEHYERAISVDPGFADAHYNRSMLLLFLGDFEKGWRGYEWRWKNAKRLAIGEVRDFPRPLWLGEQPIAGKRILLHSEAGLGDTLQFCRYASMVAILGATVYLEVPAPLLGILTGLEGVSRLLVRGSDLPAFDYHCPLMSLPLAFKTTLDTVPAVPKYLRTDKTKVARWFSLRQKPSPVCVGLVWSGNPNNTIDPRRSIRLADWLKHLPREFLYFSLQKELRAEDRTVLESNPFIRSFDGTLDFTDTAVLCECMDVVISVDTSVAHLSAALGQRTWILLPFIPDFRWLLDRDDSPWYPTAKLYRQRTVGDWDGVLARVADDLRREFPPKGSSRLLPDGHNAEPAGRAG